MGPPLSFYISASSLLSFAFFLSLPTKFAPMRVPRKDRVEKRGEDPERPDGAQRVPGPDTHWELGAGTGDADHDSVPHPDSHGRHFWPSTKRHAPCLAFSVTQRSCSSVIVVA